MAIIPPGLIGLIVSGDMGGETFYTNKQGVVVCYEHAPPKCPPTLAQIIQRYRFTMAVINWVLRPEYIKAQYERVTHLMSLDMTGINLFIHLSFSQDWHTIATIYNQTGITLGMPPPV